MNKMKRRFYSILFKVNDSYDLWGKQILYQCV